MGKDKKTLCKWDSKSREQKLKKYTRLVKNPRLVCVKCGRVAQPKKRLCKPLPLDNGG